MSDAALLAVYLPLCLISAAIIGFSLLRDRHKRLSGAILFLMFSTLGWQISYVLYYAASSYPLSYFLYDICLPFVSLGSLAMLLLVIRFYGRGNSISPLFTAALFVVPAMTTVLTLTNSRHSFLRAALVILSTTPVHSVFVRQGVWFWVHTAYCYALILSAVWVAFTQHFRIPKIFRRPSSLMIWGMLFTLVGNIFYVLVEPFTFALDLSLVGSSLSVFFVYLATRSNRGLDFLYKCRQEVFNHLNGAIFTLDDSRMVISQNAAARQWLVTLGLSPVEASYQKILDATEAAAGHSRQLDDGDAGTDYYFGPDSDQFVLSLRERGILDKKGIQIGTLVLVDDVTENRNLIRQLENEVGVDALTGLSNRRVMDLVKAELDKPEHLPMAILMGDLNNLKNVNDRLGHQQGDLLLRAAANILNACCPPSTRLGRIGGDEFLMLIPNYTPAQARLLVEEIKTRMEQAKGYPFEISMALGMAVKENEAQSLEVLLHEADENMYADKGARGRPK